METLGKGGGSGYKKGSTGDPCSIKTIQHLDFGGEYTNLHR